MICLTPTHLIGHRHEYRAQKQVRTDRKLLVDLFGAVHEKIVRQQCQNGHGHHEVVAIGFDEIVSRNGCGIDVVLAKRSQKILVLDGFYGFDVIVGLITNKSADWCEKCHVTRRFIV